MGLVIRRAVWNGLGLKGYEMSDGHQRNGTRVTKSTDPPFEPGQFDSSMAPLAA